MLKFTAVACIFLMSQMYLCFFHVPCSSRCQVDCRSLLRIYNYQIINILDIYDIWLKVDFDLLETLFIFVFSSSIYSSYE